MTDNSDRMQEQGMRSLRRLQEQGLSMARTLRPESNPVEEAFKPPDPLPHSYMVASSRPSRVIKPARALQVPDVLRETAAKRGHDPLERTIDGTGRAQDAGSPMLQQSNMRSVRLSAPPASRLIFRARYDMVVHTVVSLLQHHLVASSVSRLSVSKVT